MERHGEAFATGDVAPEPPKPPTPPPRPCQGWVHVVAAHGKSQPCRYGNNGSKLDRHPVLHLLAEDRKFICKHGGFKISTVSPGQSGIYRSWSLRLCV